MLTVAYLANQFPSPVEPYVIDEIEELRRRGVRVIAGTVRNPYAGDDGLDNGCSPQIVLQQLRALSLLQAVWLCLCKWRRISSLVARIVFRGKEEIGKRLKALLHTCLGAYYAVLLQPFKVNHIHAQHGYFGSWVAMVAARLLDVEFSMTLHGSDLLLHGAYLDVKLENCEFCLTVSEYNRDFILRHFPELSPEKIIVSRLGVDVPNRATGTSSTAKNHAFTLLTVGRLHPVKDHAFLIRACAQMKDLNFECLIAGDGPEWRNLERLIGAYGLQNYVTLLGHVAHKNLDFWYKAADLIVLTSRSEGLPLVLMEAMAHRKLVLAPRITGIPELVTLGKTGFLYQPGSMEDFVAQVRIIRSLMLAANERSPQARVTSVPLENVRRAAEMHVRQNFDRKKNLRIFGDLFLQKISVRVEGTRDENLVLQQV